MHGKGAEGAGGALLKNCASSPNWEGKFRLTELSRATDFNFPLFHIRLWTCRDRIIERDSKNLHSAGVDRNADGAWAVGDGQGGGLSDGISVGAICDLSCLRAVGGVLSDDLSGVLWLWGWLRVVDSLSGLGMIVV